MRHSGDVEEWRSAVGYEGLYEVSDRGRVRGRRGLIKPYAWNGRPCVRLYDADHRRRGLLVSWVVAAAFHGPRPDGQYVRHLNDDSTDDRAANLAYGTPGENNDDAVRNGHHAMVNRPRCPQGHAREEPNLYRSPRVKAGRGECLACRRARYLIKAAVRDGRPARPFREFADELHAEIIKGAAA